jgi:hypothetical protein
MRYQQRKLIDHHRNKTLIVTEFCRGFGMYAQVPMGLTIEYGDVGHDVSCSW